MLRLATTRATTIPRTFQAVQRRSMYSPHPDRRAAYENPGYAWLGTIVVASVGTYGLCQAIKWTWPKDKPKAMWPLMDRK
ncbi:hypothetical protein EX30DRAFT_375595 [Ascodesmis nigricans]|uniref:Uncharacterized protein n=1 Tax=Ascodesmis nigricans TaxID=341454 RepID=A0A4S2MHF5_9PEZI|nr:hypothetical protein EX30DRAFT_375595 [Ascodesmis nigricans]